jgi:long-chain acyl-CoA synthetase
LVFLGYWGEEDLTKHTFREGWHHTGDAGRKDEEGYLWFAGRKAEKELIKPGGENVYPVEVEKVILEHPNVQEVSVIGVPDPKFGEGIKAVCALKPKSKLTEQELIDFVAGKIARYKKPGYVQFVDSLPKKEDGSIDRVKVKEMYGAGPKK